MPQTIQIIYDRLTEVARVQNTTTYSEVGELVGLDMSSEVGRIRIAQILDDINWYESKGDRPMLSSVVILKNQKIPGVGYFECARALEKYHGNDDLSFWSHELNEVHNHWRE
jgi:hypothetical protein